MTLAEVSSEAVRAEPGSAGKKLWYHSDGGDLYVWRDEGGGVTGFQVTFFDHDAGDRREWWLEWGARGLRAGAVDSKETDSRTHDLKTPTVDMSNARLRGVARSAREFLAREGAALPAELRAFLKEKLAAAR